MRYPVRGSNGEVGTGLILEFYLQQCYMFSLAFIHHNIFAICVILVGENRDSAKIINLSIFMQPISLGNLHILYVAVVNTKTVVWGQTDGSAMLFQRTQI